MYYSILLVTPGGTPYRELMFNPSIPIETIQPLGDTVYDWITSICIRTPFKYSTQDIEERIPFKLGVSTP